MLSHLKKNPIFVPDEERLPDDSGIWQWRAFVAAVASWVAGGILVAGFVSDVNKLPLVATVLLGTIPVQVLGTAAVIAVLACHRRPAFWVGMIKLTRPSSGFRMLWLHTVRHLAYLVPLVMIVTALSVYLLDLAGYQARGSPLMDMLTTAQSPVLWGAVIAVAVLLAPVAEEIQFRTVLYEALCARLSRRGATWLTALIFAGSHQVPEQIPGLVILGVFLQRMRRRENSLWGSIALHAGFNLISLALFAAWYFVRQRP